jgi:hypothetical protein
VGEGFIQRKHHWSPLSDEVEFVQTQRDIERALFDCAKDRHVFPWVDVNVRFGLIKYATKRMMKLPTKRGVTTGTKLEFLIPSKAWTSGSFL